MFQTSTQNRSSADPLLGLASGEAPRPQLVEVGMRTRSIDPADPVTERCQVGDEHPLDEPAFLVAADVRVKEPNAGSPPNAIQVGDVRRAQRRKAPSDDDSWTQRDRSRRHLSRPAGQRSDRPEWPTFTGPRKPNTFALLVVE